MGQVIGATDSRAERARSGNITFQNILATIYHVLGIDPPHHAAGLQRPAAVPARRPRADPRAAGVMVG